MIADSSLDWTGLNVNNRRIDTSDALTRKRQHRAGSLLRDRKTRAEENDVAQFVTVKGTYATGDRLYIAIVKVISVARLPQAISRSIGNLTAILCV